MALSVPPSRIVFLCTKDAATFDFSAPVLVGLRRRHPDARLTVVMCALSTTQVFRGDRFYPTLLRQHGIGMVDGLATLPWPWRLCAPLVRPLLRLSRRDGKRSPTRWRRGLARLERFLNARTRYAGILPGLQPQAVLLDHRSGGAGFGLEAHAAWLLAKHVPTYLLPHAANHGGPEDFAPFPHGDDPLPPWTRYWMPFIADAHWRRQRDRREGFRYVGYPGVDGAWLGRFRTGRPRAGTPLRVLVLLRAFLPLGRKVVAADDPAYHSEAYLLEHEELQAILRQIADAVAAAAPDAEILFKPHPSTDFVAFAAEAAAAGIRRWSLTGAPIYPLLGQVDAVVSLYSTILLVPAAAGVPTLLVHSRTMDYVAQWPALRDLYQGLRLYVADPDRQLSRLTSEVLAAIADGEQWLTEACAADQAHIRAFFPDDATTRCTDAVLADGPAVPAAALAGSPHADPGPSEGAAEDAEHLRSA